MSDVIVVGGACMGAATAFNLATRDVGVTVIERDPTLRHSSTLRSDGNVRIQFNLEENIRMSQYAMEVLDQFEDLMATEGHQPDPAARKQGNLFLVDEANREAADIGLELQRGLGCEVAWLSHDELASTFPPLVSERIVGATFGPNDGSVDPGAVTQGYRRAAIARGAVFETGVVLSLLREDGRATGVTLGDGTTRRADVVVVCAGAWSTGLLSAIGVEIPVQPVMRTVYVVATDVGRGLSLPSAFLPSGLYLLPEHEGTFVMAWSLPDDPVGFDFTPAHRDRFYDVLWPELAGWLPVFDRLEVVRSWAGLYEQNTLDANGIIGVWPEVEALYMATGFSGHGFQQCHAVGRHLAQLITGESPSLDLERLSPARVLTGSAVYEHAGRII
ncbi:MAG: FAD-binding oxidoreductase [Actinobacteria bacterium]|nr:FAD-binding oxidoreductase [Actinomycetota bacterium]